MIITYSIHTVWLVITAVLQRANQLKGKICRYGMLAIISMGLILTVVQKEEALN